MKFTEAQIEAVVAEIQAWFDPPGYADSTWRMTAETILAAIPEPWQPIETAPKDGHRVLLCGDNNGVHWVTIGAWSPQKGIWISDHWADLKTPTHYMPLPEPPREP